MTPRRSASPFTAFVCFHQLQVLIATWISSTRPNWCYHKGYVDEPAPGTYHRLKRKKDLNSWNVIFKKMDWPSDHQTLHVRQLHGSPLASAHRRAAEVEPRRCGRVTPPRHWMGYCWWFRNPAIHQLRLVVCPIIYKVLAPIPGGCWGFLLSTVSMVPPNHPF